MADFIRPLKNWVAEGVTSDVNDFNGKKVDSRRLYEISFPFTDADSDEWLGIKRFRMPEKKRPQKVVNSHSRPPTFSNGDIFFNFSS